MTMNNDLINKKDKLINILKGYEKAMVAFSGGVDSTFLLKVVADILGENAFAVTIKADVFPDDETEFAEMFCEENNINHKIVEVDLLSHNEFRKNPENRCYICKKLLFQPVIDLAQKMGISKICEGSIVDDDDDYRPGKKAIAELGVLSPMKEAGLTKDNIRILSKEMDLPTWDKPSMACLASRFPYGKEINKTQLSMVHEAEKYLTKLGFKQVRVRIHDDVARIEITPDQFQKISAPQIREQINEKLSFIGFSYVALDLKGYRTGSLNEGITSHHF